MRSPKEAAFPFSLLTGGTGYSESIAEGVLHVWAWSSLCLDFTLFPREVNASTGGMSGNKATSFFCSLSDQIHIPPVQGVLEENDRCLDPSSRSGFKMAPSVSRLI